MQNLISGLPAGSHNGVNIGLSIDVTPAIGRIEHGAALANAPGTIGSVVTVKDAPGGNVLLTGITGTDFAPGANFGAWIGNVRTWLIAHIAAIPAVESVTSNGSGTFDINFALGANTYEFTTTDANLGFTQTQAGADGVQALKKQGDLVTKSADYQLLVSNSGNVFTGHGANGNGPTFTLPALADCNGGERFRFVVTESNTFIGIAPSGADVLTLIGITAGAPAVITGAINSASNGVGIGGEITLICDKNNGWYAVNVVGPWGN